MWYLWIFYKKLYDRRPQNGDPIAHNEKQNLLVCYIRQILLMFLPGGIELI